MREFWDEGSRLLVRIHFIIEMIWWTEHNKVPSLCAFHLEFDRKCDECPVLPHEVICANRFISQLLFFYPGNTPKVSTHVTVR